MSERPDLRANGGWVAWIALLLGAGVVGWHLFISGHEPPSDVDGPALESRMGGLETALQRVQQQVDGAGAEAVRLGESLASAGRRLEAVERSAAPAVRQLGDAVSALERRLGALESSPSLAPAVAEATALAAALGQRIEAVEAAQSGARTALTAQIAGLAERLDAAVTKAGGLETVLERRLGALESSPSLAPAVAEATALAAALRQRIEAVEAAQSGARTALTAQIAGLAERFDATVAKALADEVKLAEAVVEIGRKLTALEARFSTPDQAHAELLKTIVRLESQIADLKARSLRDAAELARIYFGFNSWELTATERAKLQALVEQSELKDRVISLVGFADRTGTDDYNQLLSTRRVAVVRDALLRMGVAPALIVNASGLGATAAPVTTRAGVPERENRVVFVFGTR